VQLGQNAAQRPNVDRHPILAPQNHLRRAVEARLDVGIDALVLVARAAKVDHLDPALVLGFQQDVFRL